MCYACNRMGKTLTMTLPNVSIGRGPARQGVLGWKNQGAPVELEEEAPRGNPLSRGVRALREQALQREISHMSSQGGVPRGSPQRTI